MKNNRSRAKSHVTGQDGRVWTTCNEKEFGGPGNVGSIPLQFVRREGDLYCTQWADAKGTPKKGAGKLINAKNFLIGQNPHRHALEALGLKDAQSA